MKKSLNKFIKGYMEVLYALSSVFYIGFCFCVLVQVCLLYTSPSPRDRTRSRMPSSA